MKQESKGKHFRFVSFPLVEKQHHSSKWLVLETRSSWFRFLQLEEMNKRNRRHATILIEFLQQCFSLLVLFVLSSPTEDGSPSVCHF